MDMSVSNTGVSTIEYNIDGSLFATSDDSTRLTVWIWSPKLPSAVAILIGHSPVKRSPIGQTRWKDGGNWLLDEAIDMHTLMLGNAHNYVVGLISRNEERAALPKKTEITSAGPEDMFDEGNSLDLSPIMVSHGEASIEAGGDSPKFGHSAQWTVSDKVDDFFHYRRHTRSSSRKSQ
ncbi:hypothetical protein MMC29_005767 [Sticta canariensis]|nr:hypothetical protein [Sticta canariensis]